MDCNGSKIKIEALRERDIDLLLLEEWNVNPAFAQWLLLEFFDIARTYEKFDGWHSIIDAELGESDLILTCSSHNEKIAILMENKIDASAQEKQAARYEQRAEKIQIDGNFSQVFVCIVAPENYLANDEEATQYGTLIPYEKIAEWFYHQDDLRSRYRSEVLKLAIEKERRGYRPVKHEQVTAFWKNYYNELKRMFSDAIMNEPKIVPEGSDWPMIKFPHFPDKWFIYHKLSRGCLDIETSWDLQKAQKYLQQIKIHDMTVIKTGKCFSLRLN
ncbi:MAG: PD-(D/E)XK nuclease family protein, partial [Alphaproteobacteria bacterium]|nr:PD-(D/E)XK nuclease family protein [Alphaproteobacteria bacterium]